jgi:calcineurin-like phosphoesterase
MRYLVTGHLTGRRALDDLCAAMPRLREVHALDAILVIADNPSITGPAPMGGSGMTVADRDALLDAGADLLLTGTHVWDAGHGHEVVREPRVLRSANYRDPALPGRGRVDLDIVGDRLAVLQLADGTASGEEVVPLPEAWRAHAAEPPGLVHVVGSTFSAQVFAHAVDGVVPVVIGSLSHIASRDIERLPGGTVLVPDIGYVGPIGGIGGFAPAHFLTPYRDDDAPLAPYAHESGPTQVSAILVDARPGEPAAASWVRGLPA